MSGGSLELDAPGAASALLDDPFALRVRGAGPDTALTWRARLRDDDGRVWRAVAATAEALGAAWVPAKPGGAPFAALQSLRPVAIDVRVEDPDGRAATRTLNRRLVADGVRQRRWRDGLAATLHLPAAGEPCAVVLLDATAGDEAAATAALAAALLASRGALVLAVAPPRGRTPAASALDLARERLAQVPAAAGAEAVVLGPPLPPGVPVRDRGDDEDGTQRAAAWDALLARVGARPRSDHMT